jgi:hypothetical protein
MKRRHQGVYERVRSKGARDKLFLRLLENKVSESKLQGDKEAKDRAVLHYKSGKKSVPIINEVVRLTAEKLIKSNPKETQIVFVGRTGRPVYATLNSEFRNDPNVKNSVKLLELSRQSPKDSLNPKHSRSSLRNLQEYIRHTKIGVFKKVIVIDVTGFSGTTANRIATNIAQVNPGVKIETLVPYASEKGKVSLVKPGDRKNNPIDDALWRSFDSWLHPVKPIHAYRKSKPIYRRGDEKTLLWAWAKEQGRLAGIADKRQRKRKRKA